MPYARQYKYISLLIVLIAYIWGAGQVQIPKIGDEVLYLQIARVTGESPTLLPLKYEGGVLNTKPPLLYWLGIASTQVFGKSLFAYRLPVLLVTFLSAWVVFLLALSFLKNETEAVWATTAYMGFISTFQHGRPFLVNSFEVLFLLLPLLFFYKRPRLNLLNWMVCALSWGAVSWSKSFALIAVGCFSLTWASFYLFETKWPKRLLFFGSAALVSLCIFALWFAFDPDPRLLFQQFIIGENAVKFKGYSQYFSGLFMGSYTLFRIWLGPLANAGLFTLPVVALFILFFNKRKKILHADKAFLFFILAFLIFYSLPTQRQENYLLPLMGVLAVLLAKYREVLSPTFWKVSIKLTDAIFILLSLAPVVLSLWGDMSFAAKFFWVLSIVAFPFLYFVWDAKNSYPLLVLLCFIQLTNFSDPFNKKFDTFRVQSAELWVPSRKLAQHERFRFIAPHSIPRSYLPGEEVSAKCEELMPGEFIVVEEGDLAKCSRSYETLETILDFKTRQTFAELLQIARGKKEYLIRKLYLLKIKS
ncbi:MAG: glycosyltransferase family 39 protein [Bdellovibrionota bacterium]